MVSKDLWVGVKLAAVGVALLALSGCGGNGASASSEVDVSPRTAGGSPTPFPSPWDRCDGLTGISDATALVDGGLASAFARVEVAGDSGSANSQLNGSRVAPVGSYELLAGTLPNGDLKQLELEPIVDGFDPFAAGSYFLLLAPSALGEGIYFASDGLSGSFVGDGNQLFERCPNYERPTEPLIVREGITDREEVINLFDVAIREHTP